MKVALAKINKLDLAPPGEYRENIWMLSKICGAEKIIDDQATKIAIYLRNIDKKLLATFPASLEGRNFAINLTQTSAAREITKNVQLYNISMLSEFERSTSSATSSGNSRLDYWTKLFEK